jgi:hypothetical protein
MDGGISLADLIESPSRGVIDAFPVKVRNKVKPDGNREAQNRFIPESSAQRKQRLKKDAEESKRQAIWAAWHAKRNKIQENKKYPLFQNLISWFSTALVAFVLVSAVGIVIAVFYLVILALIVVFEAIWELLVFIWGIFVSIYEFIIAVLEGIWSIFVFIWELFVSIYEFIIAVLEGIWSILVYVYEFICAIFEAIYWIMELISGFFHFLAELVIWIIVGILTYAGELLAWIF